ncbi:MAG TPA: type IV toxin-antitoxin system AbiEi family antitoxin [Methanocella sp.]|nr:type IV toxin-antitoxin system AbiEi family antitoxin [Methanocella sp.]
MMLNLFSGKSINVIRVLLVRHPKTWILRDLAAEAGVSLGQAYKVSQALIRERMAIRGSARSELKLTDPALLLKRWAAVNNFAACTEFIEFYTQEEEIDEFLKMFKGRDGPEYAFTGLAGALLVSPFVRPTNIHLYVTDKDAANRWAKQLGIMPIEGSGNVKFAITKDHSIYYGAHEIDGLRVVSNIQLYVDLINYPARGEEAAGEVLKVIREQWLRERIR